MSEYKFGDLIKMLEGFSWKDGVNLIAIVIGNPDYNLSVIFNYNETTPLLWIILEEDKKFIEKVGSIFDEYNKDVKIQDTDIEDPMNRIMPKLETFEGFTLPKEAVIGWEEVKLLQALKEIIK